MVWSFRDQRLGGGGSDDQIQLVYRGPRGWVSASKAASTQGHRRGDSSLGWVGLELEKEQETRGSQISQAAWQGGLDTGLGCSELKDPGTGKDQVQGGAWEAVWR